jgi:prepilin-type N-terminal cleavage/methylation domain-containing protein
MVYWRWKKALARINWQSIISKESMFISQADKKERKNSFGFTLIELLVVISIIGFLSALAVASLKNARVKARDARRMAELKLISKALNMYFDANTTVGYPNISRACSALCTSAGGFTGITCTAASVTNWGTLTTTLAPFMKVPVDPTNSNPYCYGYDGDAGGAGFGLVTNMESNASAESGDGGSYAGLYEIGPHITAAWW